MYNSENDPASSDIFGGGATEFGRVDDIFDETQGNDAFAEQGNFLLTDPNAFVQSLPNIHLSNVSQHEKFWQTYMNVADQFATRPEPQSAQSNTVSKWEDHFTQQYGQIIQSDIEASAPNATLFSASSEGAPKSREDTAKYNRVQRARNAANRRHSKSNKRKDSAQDEEVVDGEYGDGQNMSINMQREKNRIAAAKCRTKKKAAAKEMQDGYQEGLRRNSSLLREVRELRDQKAILRNAMLQHDSDICHCHAIHCFNLSQVQHLAIGTGGLMPPAASTSLELVSSTNSPSSKGSTGRDYSPHLVFI